MKSCVKIWYITSTFKTKDGVQFCRISDKFIPWYRKLLERKAQQLEMLERYE